MNESSGKISKDYHQDISYWGTLELGLKNLLLGSKGVTQNIRL